MSAREKKNGAEAARFPLVAGWLAVLLLVGGLGYWSVATRIAGAVIVPGVIQLESKSQVIQHPEGGVVAEIIARDGDAVEAGDVLIRFDATRLNSERSVVSDQIGALRARRLRLEAERDDDDVITLDPALEAEAADDPALATQIASERALFQARREAFEQERELLAEQTAQIEARAQGTEAQHAALTRQKELLQRQIDDQEALLGEGLAQSSRLIELQREAADLDGRIARLEADTAELRGQATGNRIAGLQLATARRETALTELRRLEAELFELTERRIALDETLSRLDVRAPVAGIVYNSQVFARQSVVRGAEPIMYLAPQDQPLVVAARIAAVDIDAIRPGQPVSLRFPALAGADMPELQGRLQRIAPDAVTDTEGGQSYYAATIVPDETALALLDDQDLVPGMPAEAFVETGSRSPLSYLTRPLTVYFDRAFRQ